MLTVGNRKIRVAHIITRLDRGGAPDVLRILFEKLDPALFELTLIYGLTQHLSEKTKKLLGGLGVKAVCVKTLRRGINPFYDLLSGAHIFMLLARGRFDIVHTHTAKAGFLGRLAAKFAGVPKVIHSPHGHDFYGYFGFLGSWLVIWAERFAALFCDKIHVLTELEKKDMTGFGICAPDKIEVIYSGVELGCLGSCLPVAKKSSGRNFTPLESGRQRRPTVAEGSLPLTGFSVGFIGRFEPVKGPQYFVEAAALAAEKVPEAKFIMAGGGSLLEKLERRISELKLKDKFEVLEWQEDVSGILAGLDVLVMPSLNEAVGRSALEAQGLGVPVVAARVGGVAEIVKDGVTGILVESKDAAALAEAIIKLLRDDNGRRQMSQSARQWVDEKFSVQRMVDNFAGLYQRMKSEIRISKSETMFK